MFFSVQLTLLRGSTNIFIDLMPAFPDSGKSNMSKDEVLLEKKMTESNDGYTPPKVWKWDGQEGGAFSNINRPIAGPTNDKELPVGRHPLQLYSL
ncbi:MAG: hypothetical protein ACI9BW_000201, partial [Gammaproteobacteria bacterium]